VAGNFNEDFNASNNILTYILLKEKPRRKKERREEERERKDERDERGRRTRETGTRTRTGTRGEAAPGAEEKAGTVLLTQRSHWCYVVIFLNLTSLDVLSLNLANQNVVNNVPTSYVFQDAMSRDATSWHRIFKLATWKLLNYTTSQFTWS
jgi:hypothetical protein